MRCQYCGKEARIVPSTDIFCTLKDTRYSQYWECLPCDAHIPCEHGTEVPVGTLANAHTRRLRQEAHKAFDPFWRFHKWHRKIAYLLLARTMGVETLSCHIAMFDDDQCSQVIQICEASKHLLPEDKFPGHLRNRRRARP